MSNHERMATERPYLSIGEVLGLLLDEFPDVTISKIRFLESQGLIEPERTASGYRKFYDADVDRLRFILREQRENYLPLKVIRDRLEGETPTGGISRPDGDPRPRVDDTTAVMSRPEVEAADAAAVAAAVAAAADTAAPEAAVADPVDELPSDADVRSHPAGSAPLPGAVVPASDPEPEREPQLHLDSSAPAATGDPAPALEAAPATPPPPPPPPPPRSLPGQLSRPELLTTAGIDGKLLEELESYGLVSARSLGQQAVYDGAARQICEIAGAFQQLGIEVRHLRAWKSSAEREAGLFEQRILPLLRQRNPSAREQSTALLEQMTTLGANLRHVLVAQALRQYTAE
jgi:DNA-binding transcriptional MerR regulator